MPVVFLVPKQAIVARSSTKSECAFIKPDQIYEVFLLFFFFNWNGNYFFFMWTMFEIDSMRSGAIKILIILLIITFYKTERNDIMT